MPSRTLGQRVERLERRVDDLSGRVGRLEERAPGGAPEAAPDEAAGAEAVAEEAPRCPGCGLEVEEPAGRRCAWCGFVFSAARPRRRRG